MLKQKFTEWEELILKNKSQNMEWNIYKIGASAYTFDNTHGTRIVRLVKGLDSHEDGSSLFIRMKNGVSACSSIRE